MKRKLISLVALLAVWGAACAAEVFDANIKARANNGKEKMYALRLSLDDPKAEKLTGLIISYGSGHCGKERKISGEQTPDGEVPFRSEEDELKGCGRFVFKGRWEKEGVLTGQMRFQGEMHEFSFKK